MKEMTLKDIQDVSLRIMKHIHQFCVENDIKYSLAYGTLIGAIRHKGFIPWDDDIDIIMSRKDYNRFISLYQNSSKYKLFCHEHKNNYTTYARVCDMTETYVRTWAPMATEEFGVWVDIFPMDYVDDDMERGIKKNKELIRLNHKIFQRRSTMASLEYYGKKRILKQMIKKVLFRKNIHELIDEYISKSLTHTNNSHSHVGVLCVSVWWSEKNEYFPVDIINNFISVPFEDTKFYALKEFDNYLSSLYGNYMELPPEEKRKGHTVHKYYWKNQE